MIYNHPFQWTDIPTGWIGSGSLDANGNGVLSFQILGLGFVESDFYSFGSITRAFMQEDGFSLDVTYKTDETIKSYYYVLSGIYVESYVNDEGPYARKAFNEVLGSYQLDYKYTLRNGTVGYEAHASANESFGPWSVTTKITDLHNNNVFDFVFLGIEHNVSGLKGKYAEYGPGGLVHLEQGVGDGTVRVLDYNNGVIKSEVKYNGFAVTSSSTLEDNGDRTTYKFDKDKVLSETVSHTNGSSSEFTFDGYGSVLKHVERGADNSSDVLFFKNDILTGHNVYSAGGKLAVSDTITNGQHTAIAHQSGQVLEGGSLADTFTEFGATTFVFREHFGKDTIRGFDAQPGADHDVLSLIGTAAHSFADLVVEQVGYNTKVMVDSLDYITLTNVTAVHITADDFLFA